MLGRLALVLALVAAAAGCGRDKIAVNQNASDDYKHGALVAAVDKFAKANRTPEAYAELSQTITALRPQFDRQVGKEAELRLVVLALGPIQQYQTKPMRER